MLEESIMEKKSTNRSCQPPARYAVADSKKSNESSHKLWPRNNKKRENFNNPPKNEPFRKNVPAQKGRAQINSKTKVRNKSNFSSGGMEITWLDDQEQELESLLAPGGRKQNISHLLNFRMPERHTTTTHTAGMLHRQGQYRTAHRHEKDLYLRAYCQFVVKDDGELNENFFDPDIPIKWEKIEEVIVRGTGRTECPICLGPPVAGRIGHCGHIYCWACTLHYADSHEKDNPPCPVCATPLHVYDMKPARMIQWKSSVTEVTLRLVRRLRGSTIVEVAPKDQDTDPGAPEALSPLPIELMPTAPFCKWFTATKMQICGILMRERKEINEQIMAEIDTTEVVYLEKALELLKAKEDLLISKPDCANVSVDTNDYVDKDVKDGQKKYDWFDEEGAACLESVQYKTAEMHLECQASEAEENSSDGKSSEADEGSNADIASLLEHEDFKSDVTEIDSEKSNLTAVDKEMQAKYFYFYQAEDGQPVFLHRMNVRVLCASWGALVAAPAQLRGRLLARETLSLDEQTKKHMPYTAHLPLHCSFDIVELDLQPPYVTKTALDSFSDDLKRRARFRAKQQREELRRERAYSRSLEGPPRPDISSEVLFPPALPAHLPPPPPPPLDQPAQPLASSPSSSGPSFAQMASTSGQWRIRKSMPSPPPEPVEEDPSAPRALSLGDAFMAAMIKTSAGKNKKKHKILFSNAMPHANL